VLVLVRHGTTSVVIGKPFLSLAPVPWQTERMAEFLSYQAIPMGV
jgi:hypothetical protein